jgi:tripartite-type tricarboxylate transporter receptor subunit TctC
MTSRISAHMGAGLSVLAGVGLLCMLPGAPAAAEPSLQGKTLRIIINSRAGGGTDAYARLVGGILPEFLPGTPQIIFQNLPGGGGIKANNYFFAKTKPDGLTALAGSRTQVSPHKLRHKSAKYNPAKYHFIGGTERLGSIILINKDPKIKARLADPKAKPVAFGGIDGERSGSHGAVWAKEYLGWNLKFVLGYSGTPQMLLAARRGEIDMVHNQTLFNTQPLMKENMDALVQLGNRGPNGELLQRPAFKGVPVLGHLIEAKLDARAKKAFAVWLDDQTVEKWMALPPGTPGDYVKVWRAAYNKVMNDKRYKDVVQREFGDDYGWFDGAKMDKLVAGLAATTDEELAFFTKLRVKHGLAASTKKKTKAVKVKIADIKRGGREIYFKVKGKTHKAKISGSRTDVTINGEMESRGKLVIGMSCTVAYPGNGKEAKSVKCKK